MFQLFRRKTGQKKIQQLSDLENNLLDEGDLVECLRYELGESKLILVENEWYYESLRSGKRVSYVKMIDAITSNQKVRKIIGR